MANKARSSLEEYHKKRDFSHTSEPRGDVQKRKNSELSFVIQKHDASHLHYDLRLEVEGVMKSWAVPKGPSLDPKEKRLAVHTEDHPIEYNTFEGNIPEGEYGAGEVIVWDRGTWTPNRDPVEQYQRGKLTFTLQGEKLQGAWVLLQMKGRGKNNWLLKKIDDEYAQSEEDGVITEEHPESILTGKVLQRDKTSRKGTHQPKATSNKDTSAKREKKEGFELALLIDTPPSGNDWIVESKLDGYRVQTKTTGRNVSLLTRNGKDFTSKFPSLAQELTALLPEKVVLDGEVVWEDSEGKTNFQALQNMLSEGREGELLYYVFDVLEAKGKDLRKTPLIQRKTVLKNLVKAARLARLRCLDFQLGNAEKAFQSACSTSREGIICKKKESVYLHGRTGDWVKVKCHLRQEFVVGGFTSSTNKDFALGALLLGYYEKGKLHYAGKVGTGFTLASREELSEKLHNIRRTNSPFVESITSLGAQWVAPQLVAEIEFTEWTRDGKLRHPSFVGLREDKEAREVVRESAEKKEKKNSLSVSAKRPVRGKEKDEPIEVAGVTITHPSRSILPGSLITKGELAEYYASVGPRMLPFISNRPLTMVRCPQGGKTCFFQRHAQGGIPDDIPRVSIEEENGEVQEYCTITTVHHLLQLVQLNTVEFHTWSATTSDLEHPDRMVFDLDPSPELSWEQITTCALELKNILEGLGLKSFAKTSGGKGIHVIVPLLPTLTWNQMKEYAEELGTLLIKKIPALVTLTSKKIQRKGKIYFDYLRNVRGATTVVPYSVRAKEHTLISMPLTWKMITEKPTMYTISYMRSIAVKGSKEPWPQFSTLQQSFPTVIKRK